MRYIYNLPMKSQTDAPKGTLPGKTWNETCDENKTISNRSLSQQQEG